MKPSNRKRTSLSHEWTYNALLREHVRKLLPTLKAKVMHTLMLDLLDGMDHIENEIRSALDTAREDRVKGEVEQLQSKVAETDNSDDN